MKVAFISHEGIPIKSGGVTLLNDLVCQFMNLNISVITYLPKFKGHGVSGNSTTRRLPVTRGSIGGISPVELMKFLIFGTFSLRKQIKKDKITHIYSIFAFPSGLLVYLATIGMSIQKIVIVDAIDLPGIDNSPLNSHKFLRSVVRHTLNHSNKILLIQGLEEEFEKFCKLQYTSVIAGISPPRLIKNQIRNHSQFKILTIARLIERKNVSLSIRILKEMIELDIPARLTIIGDGPEMSSLQQLAEELNIKNCIDFQGFLNENDLLHYLVSCDAYLFTGSNEGISIALLQALSFGVPAVVKQNDGNSKIFGKLGQKFIVGSSNPQDYAELLSKLYTDIEYRSMAEKISLEMVKPFLWQNAINSYLPEETNRKRS